MPCAVSALAGAPRSVLIVAAHPDDETVGFGAAVGELSRGGWRVEVLHVTDGAPRDPRLRPTLAHLPRAEAARARREEARAALRAQEIADPDRVLLAPLGVADQEAPQSAAAVARAVADRIVEREIRVVVAHAYEGGHPDHDAVAFASHAAAVLARARSHPVALAEMSSYHRLEGALVTGRFRSEGAATVCAREWSARLDGPARARKRAMLGAFASQVDALSAFGVDSEPVRCAPSYDFARPPHRGALNYELWGFGVTGASVSERLVSAAKELGLEPTNLRARLQRSIAPKRYL